MAPKSLVLAALLIIAVVVSAGQLPRGAAGLGASANTNTSLVVSGVVPCATGNSINLATVPSFPNAVVQLVCGDDDNNNNNNVVVGSTTTDSTGAFRLSHSYVTKALITTILHNLCKVVVVTPLGACDESLAGVNGTLSAPLKLLGITTGSGSDLGGLGGLIGGIVGLVGQIIGGILNLGTMSFSFV